jgi:hypothetical protein
MSKQETSDKLKNKIIPHCVGLLAVCTFIRLPPHSTITNWGNFLGLIDQIDDDFDNAPADKKLQIKAQAVELVMHSTGDYSTNPLATKVQAAIPDSMRAQFASDLTDQFQTCERLADTPDPKLYADLTVEDGQTAARFFRYFLPESFLNKPAKLRVFEIILKKIAGITKIADSIKDLPEDHASGQTQVTDLETTAKELKLRLARERRELIPALLFSLRPNS